MSAAPAPVGLLLAAGRGRRFDASGTRLKLLEPLLRGPQAGTAIAVAAARALLVALPRVIAVVRPVDGEPQLHLHSLLLAEGCDLLICPDCERGMGASLAAGVRASLDAPGWLVALADMPDLRAGTVAVVAAALGEGALTAAPMYRKQRGHPVAFAAALGAELAALDGEAGARELLRRYPPRAVPVDDPGTLRDIDHPEDLA
jgi:molybdenum cofactor cytidylyltransferase